MRKRGTTDNGGWKRIALLCGILVLLWLYYRTQTGTQPDTGTLTEIGTEQNTATLTDGETLEYCGTSIPWNTEETYVVIHGNEPFFEIEDFSADAFETYSQLDSLGRCGQAFANICTELMPTEKRGEIGNVKPTGWINVKYDSVDGYYLYNRCHLIGFQLAGENANPQNLITGTRWFNVQGMLPFENMVADYVEETDGHVLYRVTPLFVDDELVARGVVMEAGDVETGGEEVEFCVFVYNVQPGIEIDYSTGRSHLKSEAQQGTEKYVLNVRSGKFHHPWCSGVQSMSESSKKTVTNTSREAMIQAGYSPCSICNP